MTVTWTVYPVGCGQTKSNETSWCPVVGTPCLHWVRPGFDPCSGSYDPASRVAKKKSWVISLRDETPVLEGKPPRGATPQNQCN